MLKRIYWLTWKKGGITLILLSENEDTTLLMQLTVVYG